MNNEYIVHISMDDQFRYQRMRDKVREFSSEGISHKVNYSKREILAGNSVHIFMTRADIDSGKLIGYEVVEIEPYIPAGYENIIIPSRRESV